MFDDRTPIYQQIAARLKQDILDGTLAEGDQVMSTNQYATYYRINPATAAKGVHQLVEEGVLHKRRGLGMYVTEGAREKLLAQRRDRFFTEMVEPMAAEASLIGVPLADVVRHLEELENQKRRMR
ncbi:GntR family transcriptional regulator [Phytomonospora endophytica]|uniref:DNA-binding transcriptional regulator YhcF (GntR family) n=1 Tax=Phytomonospora endophytica TaxID=714109 RepID=A0A841F5R7_9ACTN|nr:GntR family transcriptional regulator [Phytomonospora endophytica]MBB6032261.1 DNA-binding transcriptional regulator YhcF (GntR family) [Phytomonospora endophytica]GIG68611.1 GntR family transcriptional regulator [Phytomonospora endophytica]